MNRPSEHPGDDMHAYLQRTYGPDWSTRLLSELRFDIGADPVDIPPPGPEGLLVSGSVQLKVPLRVDDLLRARCEREGLTRDEAVSMLVARQLLADSEH